MAEPCTWSCRSLLGTPPDCHHPGTLLGEPPQPACSATSTHPPGQNGHPESLAFRQLQSTLSHPHGGHSIRAPSCSPPSGTTHPTWPPLSNQSKFPWSKARVTSKAMTNPRDMPELTAVILPPFIKDLIFRSEFLQCWCAFLTLWAVLVSLPCSSPQWSSLRQRRVRNHVHPQRLWGATQFLCCRHWEAQSQLWQRQQKGDFATSINGSEMQLPTVARFHKSVMCYDEDSGTQWSYCNQQGLKNPTQFNASNHFSQILPFTIAEVFWKLFKIIYKYEFQNVGFTSCQFQLTCHVKDNG